MILRKMTASFGRLDKETLTLQEGLNIIHAPNEWGKSTWCAFLRCMLYGVDSSRREKAGYKPDKLRYAPWSGAPMAGVMDICWHGEEIRLQRNTRLPSAPMREFSAVYAATGHAVPELTESSAGEIIIGASEEVFRRTAFLGQGELVVSAGADLEKKITGLVSTGEEEISFAEAAERLRAWQRHRRWRNKGRLPEIEEEQAELCRHLASMESLREELTAVEEEIQLLEKQQSQTRQRMQSEQFNRREEAIIRMEKAQSRQHKLEETALLRRREAEERIQRLKDSPFAGQHPSQARQRVEADMAAAAKEGHRPRWGWIVPALLFLGGMTAVAGVVLHNWLVYLALGIFLACAVSAVVFRRIWKRKKQAVSPVYTVWGVQSGEELRQLLENYTSDWRSAEAAARLAKQVQQEAETARLEQKAVQSQVIAQLSEEGEAAEQLRHSREQYQALLENRAALKTRLDVLGDPLVLSSRQQQLTKEKTRLEAEYEALEIALREMDAANSKLTSEFSPQLARRTACWLSRLTGGRYSELTLDRELQAMLRRQGDILPREGAFLSRGTLDQLYLAMRMALCELVLPSEEPCPLVLDDALVTFDEERLGYAMDALEELSKTRQILLFTCQDREERYRSRKRGGEL